MNEYTSLSSSRTTTTTKVPVSGITLIGGVKHELISAPYGSLLFNP
jgi:hypothetical protein